MKATPTFRIEQRTPEPMLVADRPYEDFQIGYPNVIREGNVWHLWYEAYDHNYKSDADGYLCYARSTDGMKWEKPNLGLVEYGGNKSNNILIAGAPIGGVHGHTVFLDPAAPAAERFKLVFTKSGNGGWLVAGGTSPDGTHWKLIDKLLLARNSDTQTVCFRDGEVYRMYVRMWSKGTFGGQRLVGYTESKIFGDFPDPVAIVSPDDKDPADLNFYNSAATKLRDGAYVMFPSAYYSAKIGQSTREGTVVPHMAVSTDGRTWERVGREPKIILSQGFDSKSIYVGPGAVPGDKPGTWWFYYMGHSSGHDDPLQKQLRSPHGGLGRFLLVEEKAPDLPQGKEKVQVTLGEPVTVVLAPPTIRNWGPYQFPGLERLPDGKIRISVHVEADSATAYGLPPLQAVSADKGKTWTVLPKEQSGSGTASSWSNPLCLPNGDRMNKKTLRPLKPAEIKLPAKPFGQFASYGITFSYYRVEDLPPECRNGWRIYRNAAGAKEPVEEKAVVRLPGELRYTAEGVMPLPWGPGHRLLLAPDGAVWAVGEDCRAVDGKFRQKWAMIILRSTDNGRSFDLWGEIPYAPDPAVDPKAAARDGFTEPCVNFMPDGSILCLLRTTDGNGVGPMYVSRSADNGKSWSKPVVFDDLGVWPQMLTLKNGVTLAAYGRPGLYVRASHDPAGAKWSDRVEVVKPGSLMKDTCSYASLLPLSDSTALIAYSEFNLPGPDGQTCKGIRVRTITAKGDQPMMKEKRVEAKHGIVCRLPGERFGYFGWPTVARLDDGTLLVASSGLRSQHVCPWGKTVLNVSTDDGRTWSPPRVINDSPLDDRDAGIVNLGGKRLLATWFASDNRLSYSKGEHKTWVGDEEFASWGQTLGALTDAVAKRHLGSWIMLSHDAAATWGAPIRVPVSTPHGPIRLRNGDLLYLGKPFGTMDDMSNASITAARSKDGGLTWEVLGQVPVYPGSAPANYHEPHAVELPSGTLLGMIRIENHGGKDLKTAGLLDFSIMQTESTDGGRTWSVPKPLGFHGSPPHLLRHSSGLLILTYGYRQAPYGQRVAFSRDDGKTWDHDWIIRDDGPDGDLGYPSTVELADGSLFTVCYQRAAAGEKCSLLWSRWKLP